MLVSRRELLSMATLAAFLQKRGIAKESCGDVYRNDRAGFALRKPVQWHFHSSIDFQSSRAKQAFSEEGERFKDVVAALDGLPLLVLGEQPASFEGFTPSVTVWHEEDDFEDLDDDPVALLREALKGWSSLVEGVKTVRSPESFVVGRKRVAVTEWEFLYRVDDGRCWVLHARTLFLLEPHKIQTVHFYREKENHADAGPLSEIEESIRFY